MKKILLFLLLPFAFAGKVTGQARLIEKVVKKGDEVSIPYTKYILPNGLTVILHEDHSDPLVHVNVSYHVGSAREDIGKTGFAHFFEHMMFEGSENAPKGEFDKLIFNNGGNDNGATDRDHTYYYENIPKNLLQATLWLEADRMGFLLAEINQEHFDIQRATVKNERGQEVENKAYGLAPEYIAKTLYPYGHPYSWITISVKDLDNTKVDDIRKFFLRWYGPNNATLSIGGDINSASTLKMVEKYFGTIQRSPVVEKLNVPSVLLKTDRYVSYTDNYARYPALYITYPTVPDYTKDVPALECLAEILGQGRNNVLYNNMVKNQAALRVSASSGNFELAGEFNVRIIAAQNKSLADVQTLYDQALDSLEKNGISDDELQKFKGGVEAEFVDNLQSVAGKVSRLAEFQTFTKNPNLTAKQLRGYLVLTRQDVINAFHKYIYHKPAVYLSILPKGQEKLIAHTDQVPVHDSANYIRRDYGYAGLRYLKPRDKFNRKVIPPTGLPPVTHVPAFWRKDMPSGAKVIGVSNPEVPLITLSITLPGGRLAEQADLSKMGISSLFASMMLGDTKHYTAEQFATMLQKLGSSIQVTNTTDGIQFSLKSLKKNFNETMLLLRERILYPQFKTEEFDRDKKQTLESLKMQRSQPATIANAAFARVNYGKANILGNPEDGDETSVKNISLKDIRSYYDNTITANGAKIVIVGDITESQILPRLGFLDSLPVKNIIPESPAPALAINKTKIYLVDVPKAGQTEFRIGSGLPLRYDPIGDYYKLIMTNYPFGGDYNGRLNIYMRETKGWTYGAYMMLSADKYVCNYFFKSGIRTNVTDSAVVAFMRIYKDYSETGPAATEVINLRKALLQRDALRYETQDQKLVFMSRMLNYNLPVSYVDKQNYLIANTTREQLKEVAATWMKPAQVNILLVGDKAAILPKLKGLGYDIVELDTNGNPLPQQ